ncbi:MAG: hypothetical protein LC772_10885 [Chloroflexi bacterium]|nr:hypothetical protein [Chloroflexota bacterium]
MAPGRFLLMVLAEAMLQLTSAARAPAAAAMFRTDVLINGVPLSAGLPVGFGQYARPGW